MPDRAKVRRNGLGLPISALHHERLHGIATSTSAGVRQHIESVADVRRLAPREQRILAQSEGGRPVALTLGRCHRGRRCCSPACKRCARLFRLWIAPQAIAYHQRLAQSLILTLNLVEIPEGDLLKVDPRLVSAALRKKLKRFGINACFGNLEVAYKPLRRCWCLHAHILVFRCSAKRLRAFAERYELIKVAQPQEVRHPVEQVSYLFKYVTYHRHPGSRRALPLPSGPLIEVSIWRARYAFVDFLVLIGFQRRGSIVPASRVGMKVRADVGRRGDVATRSTNLRRALRRDAD